MSSGQGHPDDSTVEGIPADEADLHGGNFPKHVKPRTPVLQDQYAGLRYPDQHPLLQTLQEIQAGHHIRHDLSTLQPPHPDQQPQAHEDLHSTHEHTDSGAGQRQAEHERQANIAVPQPSYAHMLDSHLNLHHSQSLSQHYHSQAYYQHLAAAQYHQGHMHEMPIGSSYLPPAGNLQHNAAGAYLGGEDPGVGVEADRGQEMTTMEEHDAAAHLAALRNLRTGASQEGMSNQQLAHEQGGLQEIEGHAYYDAAEAHPGIPLTQGRGYATGSKKRSWKNANEEVGEMDPEFADAVRSKRRQNRRPDRLCHFEGCFVTPTYNYPGQKKRIFCVTHKKDGMVNVVAKRCAHLECPVNPRFNYEGQPRGLYCSEHKLPDMVNVIDRRCQEPNCKKFPSHNYPGLHKKLYCATHKKEGMIDMSHGGGGMGL